MTLYDLGRRCLHAPHWRWLPSMVDTNGNRILSETLGCTDGRLFAGEPDPVPFRLAPVDPDEGAPPDLSDAATLGAIEEVIREHYGDAGPPAHAAPSAVWGRSEYGTDTRFWILWVPDARARNGYREAARATTRAEVLVLSLEGL